MGTGTTKTMGKGDGAMKNILIMDGQYVWSGGLLTDKKYMFSTTWNAPEKAF